MNAQQQRYSAAKAALEAGRELVRRRLAEVAPSGIEAEVAAQMAVEREIGYDRLVAEWRIAIRELLAWGRVRALQLCRPELRAEVAELYDRAEQWPGISERLAEITARLP